jgi:hypothetical protein
MWDERNGAHSNQDDPSVGSASARSFRSC